MASETALRSPAATSQSVLPIRRVAIVTRVSSERQASNDEGSLKTQLQRLRAHIEYKRNCGEQWQEVAVYELRAISGKNSLRSADLQLLFGDIESGRVSTILCTALDRISRSVKDFLNFFEFLAAHGAEFVCLKQNYDTTTAHGRLFATMMVLLAQFEREQTSERTRDAVAARAERGLWNGGRLFGYDLDPERKGYLLVNQKEAEIVGFAFETYLARGSIAGTVDALNAAGYRTKAYTSRNNVDHGGSPFYVSLVQTLLQNPAHIGLKEVGKIKRLRAGGVHAAKRLVPALWPPIVDRETFEAVQALMRANGQTRTNQAREVRHAYVLNSGLSSRCWARSLANAGSVPIPLPVALG